MGLTQNQKIITAAAVAVAVGVTIGILIATLVIHNRGRIVTIGIEIYQDQQATEPLQEIDWNDIRPGETKVYQAWIKNTQTLNATLSLQTSNYQPAQAQQYLTTTWDYQNGTVLRPQQTIPVAIYLTVSQDARDVTNFSYDITITATEKK